MCGEEIHQARRRGSFVPRHVLGLITNLPILRAHEKNGVKAKASRFMLHFSVRQLNDLRSAGSDFGIMGGDDESRLVVGPQ